VVRLPGAVKDVFSGWLDRHQPMTKEKVLGRIRSFHDGGLNGTKPGGRNKGSGEGSKQLNALFHACCRKHGLSPKFPELDETAFRKVTPGQGELF
jgi:hypothetical protein